VTKVQLKSQFRFGHLAGVSSTLLLIVLFHLHTMQFIMSVTFYWPGSDKQHVSSRKRAGV
jgi:hypothetical protein